MEHHLQVSKTARYYTSGPINKEVREVWIVLHGYGQLASFFLRKFESLSKDHRLFVAPEALHRYYRSGNSGRVGASWMTKEDRLTDIEDYIAYLSKLQAELAAQLGAEKWNVLGFSQGAATAVRWVAKTNFELERLVLWAGSFPPDVDLETGRDRLRHTELEVVVGEKDEFIDATDIRSAKEFLDAQGVSYCFHSFEGGHDIPKQALLDLYSQWTSP